MTAAALYLRVSTRQQVADDRTSLALQEKECRAAAAREGLDVVGVGSDVFTGYDSLDERPGLQKVRDLVQSGVADAVIVWKYDRGARDQLDLLLLHREVSQAGGRFISATQGEVENTAQGRMMLGIQGGFAEIERETIRDRLHGNMREKVLAGRIKVGAVPKYGYSYAGDKKNTYIINPDTAPTVRRLYQMADEGKSLAEMARILYADGVMTPSQYLASIGKLPAGRKIATSWARQSIFQLLTDPTYCGRYVAYRRKAVKKGKRKVMQVRDDADEMRVEQAGLVPALVSVEQWTRVRTALANNSLASSNAVDQEDMPLLSRGIAVCGHCGARAIVMKHASGYRGYACPNRQSRIDGDRPPCPGGYWFLRASEVDGAVMAQVSEMARDTEAFQRMLEAPRREAQAKLDAANRREGMLQAELEAARKQRDTISRRMIDEEDDEVAAMYRTRYKETLRQIESLEARQSKGHRTHDRLSAYLDTIAKAVGMVRSGDGKWRGRMMAPADVSVEQLATELGTQIADAYNHGQANIVPDGWTAMPPTPTRDQKRNLLRAIGAQVKMYAGKSDYARDNGKRWNLEIVPGLYDSESIS